MDGDEGDIGYCNLTDEETVYQMQCQNEETGDDNDDVEDGNNVTNPTVSNGRESLD